MSLHRSSLRIFFSILATLAVPGAATADAIDLSVGTAAQSTQLDSFVASNALDGINNFTHTLSSDLDPTWQVLLPADFTFQEITLKNRGGNGSWLSRFRDLTVQVIDFNGDVHTDFNGGTVVWFSPILNPGNVLNSPTTLTVDTGGVTGNMIRITRIPDPPGSGGVLSLDEVSATAPERIVSFAAATPVITPGDPVVLNWETHPDLSSLTLDHGIGNALPLTTNGIGSKLVTPGPPTSTTYTLSASDANGSSTATVSIAVVDEPLIYSFTADNGFVTAGASVNLNWNVSGNTTALTLNGANVLGSTGTSVSPTAGSTYVLEASNANGTVTRTVVVHPIEPGVPVINEFLAANSAGITDVDGDHPDWIELHNPGPDPAPLLGYHLTDDPDNLTKWAFPDVTMAPGGHLVVFASNDDRTNPAGELHTNFDLASAGEYLALVKPDGFSIVSEFHPAFPEQRTNVSYGFDALTATTGYFTTPTPGAPNGASLIGFVRDTIFSVDRGFYTTPVSVAITSLTPGALVRYTLDGSKPTASSGLVYTSGTPVTISETSVLRAAAFKYGHEPTNVDTHTYIFKADVITHPNMDTGITADPVHGPQMDAALSAIPSVSLTFAEDLGYDEQEVSIEFINFEGKSTQADAGMHRYGGYVTDFAKRSARINFRREYGPGKLNFDLFENHDWPSYQPAKEYDAIELRAGNHDMAMRGAYLSNRYADDALLDMGQISPHGRFVHVYMNGEYWGQYHLRERWSASMLSEYFGGAKEEYEAINANNSGGHNFQTGDVYDGDGTQWTQARSLVSGPAPFTSARTHLDFIDIIDFMLLWSSGNCEAEFRAAGSPNLGIPFKFQLKDADGFLRNPGHGVERPGPLDSMSLLKTEGDPEFEMLLADRIHKHFYNDGALTAGESVQRLQDRVDETGLSILAECARWGYRTPESWRSYQDNLLNNQLPGLDLAMIGRFETAGMLPAIDAPVYSRHGGPVTGAGPTISVTNTDHRVYYAFGPRDTNPDPYRHSLDPRLPGGGIHPAATMIAFDGTGGVPTNFVLSGDIWSYLDDGSDQGTAWRATNFVENGAWQSGPSELGYGDGDEATVVGYIDTDPGTGGIQKNITTYFRKSGINIPDPSLYDDFTLSYWYDDGIIIYVNGVEVERLGLSANPSHTETSTITVTDNAFGSIQLPTSRFMAGNNTIAVEIHQRRSNSSDISFDLTLVGNLPGGGGPSSTSDPIPVTTSGWLLSRTYDSATGEWSALNEAFFYPDPIPADATNLVISELHYHPDNPRTATELAVATDPDAFEFIEFKNVALQPVDLSGVAFTDGIDFTFAANNIIPAGGRVVIVKNKEAFEARYPSQLGTLIYGTDSLGQSEYGGKLSNDGERVVLEDAVGGIIHDFTYNDQLPWPTAADGPGFSLVLISPNFPVPDHNVASNWAASARFAGNPGQTDAVGFVGDPNADEDGDGIEALVEYALGSSDIAAGDGTLQGGFATYDVAGQADQYLTLSFIRNQHTHNAVTIEPQVSEDLINWTSVPDLVLVSETDNLNGTYTVVYRSAVPYGQRPSGGEYIRVLVHQ